jgi:uncharacterized membrane protein YadS
MGLRSSGLLPAPLLPVLATSSGVLTVVAMAGLGLTVDVRQVVGTSGRVAVAVVLSMAVLGLLSLGMLHVLAIA